jgi:hypothetical protein
MGATVWEVLASRSACCVGTGIKNGDARSLVTRPDCRSLSLLFALLMMEARWKGDCHLETDRRDCANLATKNTPTLLKLPLSFRCYLTLRFL